MDFQLHGAEWYGLLGADFENTFENEDCYSKSYFLMFIINVAIQISREWRRVGLGGVSLFGWGEK
jgi:hypothetical protein